MSSCSRTKAGPVGAPVSNFGRHLHTIPYSSEGNSIWTRELVLRDTLPPWMNKQDRNPSTTLNHWLFHQQNVLAEKLAKLLFSKGTLPSSKILHRRLMHLSPSKWTTLPRWHVTLATCILPEGGKHLSLSLINVVPVPKRASSTEWAWHIFVPWGKGRGWVMPFG